MIKPKKSAKELWNQLGLRNHIKQTFEEKDTTWGQIVDSNKKNLSQRSISEYTITQRLKEQHTSFIKNKEKPNTKTFLEDQIEKCTQEREEWQQLAIVNDKSQISQSPNRNSNDQTFSPINRLRNDEQQSQIMQTNQIQQNICKLQGHENNQYKFICLDNDCPYKLQKACAHCVIKLHTKHVSQMKEIENYEILIDQNLKKAEELMDKSQLLLKIVQKPYDEYFQQIKNSIINLINDIQQKYQQINKDTIQQLISNDIENIQNYNSKFEAYKLMNQLIPDNMIIEYQKIINSIMDKTKLNINLEPLNKQIDKYITDIFYPKQQKENKEFIDETDILQQLVSTTTRDINKESIIKPNNSMTSQSLNSPPTNKKVLQTKLVMGQASPLNVFNRQIQGRQITKIVQQQPTIVYYRTNN